MQSLESVPQWLASAWNIDLVSAQLILSFAVFTAFVFPILYLRKERSAFNVEIIAGVFSLALCVGLGWLHYWVLIVAIVFVALAAALLGTNVIFGR